MTTPNEQDVPRKRKIEARGRGPASPCTNTEGVQGRGVRGPKDKRTIAVKNLSSRDIAKKRRELAKQNDKPSEEERAAARRIRGAEASMRKARVKATVTMDREAKTWFAVLRIPLDQLERVWSAEAPPKRR